MKVLGNDLSAVSSVENYPSAEELIAKARAPVKREYLIFNTAPRVMAKSIVITTTPQEGATTSAAETGNIVAARPTVDKKSKLQLKRERQEARSNESAENICGAVAKAGDTKACKFGASCRFNHDLTAFMEQVRLTEMLLGPPPAGFIFSPKHKSNAYDKTENG